MSTASTSDQKLPAPKSHKKIFIGAGVGVVALVGVTGLLVWRSRKKAAAAKGPQVILPSPVTPAVPLVGAPGVVMPKLNNLPQWPSPDLVPTAAESATIYKAQMAFFNNQSPPAMPSGWQGGSARWNQQMDFVKKSAAKMRQAVNQAEQ